MTFEEFVSRIGDVIGLDDMAPLKGEDGISRFYLDLQEDITIVFMDVPELGMMLTTCQLGGLPLENREAVMLDLLAANGAMNAACGGTLSFDSEKEQVCLSRYDAWDDLAGVDVEHFLESFITDVATWHERLGKIFTEDVPEECQDKDDAVDIDSVIII